MTALAEPLTPEAGTASATREAFFDRVRSVNPFTANRVNGPSETAADVDEIHRSAFERLTALAGEACAEGRGIGAVLWGEAGIGKSHLLARLVHWADRDKNACAVYLHNLQASPPNLPRSLLRAVVSILTRGRQDYFHDTPLLRLVNAGVRAALVQDGAAEPTTLDQAGQAFGRLAERLCQHDPSRAALVDRAVYRALFGFFRSDYLHHHGGGDDGMAALAVRWLAGDPLDPAEARRLGLPPGPAQDEPAALADNQQVKQVLAALTQLARFRGQPFLLCLDQVDNLDEDQVAALARFLEALIDSAANLLVVTAGVQATLVRYRTDRVIQASAWDRLAQFEVALQRVPVPEGRRLVAARLDEFLKPFRDLEPVRQRRERDPLFPLGESWAEAAFRDRIELRPRDVLNWAREGWRHEQQALQAAGGPAWLAAWAGGLQPPGNGAAPGGLTGAQQQEALDAKVEQKRREHRDQRLAEPHTLPPDGDNLAGLVQALLEQCLGAGLRYGLADVERPPIAKYARERAVDLIARFRPDGRDCDRLAGLLFLVNTCKKRTAASLRRLLNQGRPPDRLLLVTDGRRPLPLGDKGEEYLAELRRRPGFRLVEVSFPEYAELDALQAVVGLACAGDLEVEEAPGQARRVSPEEVIASHHRRGRYQAAPVLRELLAPEAPPMAG